MGLRFRRSVKLFPGVRMNFSGSGLGFSVGPRGASVSVGPSGTYWNAGIPGTGLSSRTKIGGSAPRQVSPRAPVATVERRATVIVEDDGSVRFEDENGNRLDDSVVKIARSQQGDKIMALLHETADKINASVESADRIHVAIPDCRKAPRYETRIFDIEAPAEPPPFRSQFLDIFLKQRLARRMAAHQALVDEHARALQEWTNRKAAFEAAEIAQKRRIELDVLRDTAVMEEILEQRLQAVDWPRETTAAFELTDGGERVWLDVDLPEVEQMPRKTASVPSRGLRLSLKELSDAQVRKLYMRHIHAVVLRVTGETFAALPRANVVTVSGYSQRPDPATGQIVDEYLLSVQISRPEWERMNFGGMENLDVVVAVERFALRRDMTKTGIFHPIAPFGRAEVEDQ